jgi:hypothetical protein
MSTPGLPHPAYPNEPDLAPLRVGQHGALP